jgi:RHS repeat-associated protein
MTLGNSSTLTQNYTWNDRFQPVAMTATQGGNTLLQLNFYPCLTNGTPATSCASGSGNGNNGNLLSQSITMTTPGQPNLSLTQTYAYDHLNRLTQAQETGGGANWAQTYNYDTVGNRWIAQSNSTGLPALTLETPQAQSWYSTTVPNRIVGWGYDKNGNVTQVGSMARSFTYDAENRQVTATVGSATATYAYDGEGQRVSKTVAGQTTTFVYDAFGNLAAEYGGNSSGCGTCYVTTDHLGSTRLLTNTGGVFGRYDYQPFGTEILSGVDGRTTTMGFSALLPDNTNPKFTGQYQDVETADPNTGSALDWFQVRQMSGSQGRFQSPDPANAGADPSNPQSWNGYAYVGNNPLSYTDPSGMFVCVSCDVDETGNPVAIGIAAAIDIGELLAGLFGFGGGPPPSIASSLATPSSPIMGPTFSVTGWETADTVAPWWSPVDGIMPLDLGLLFFAQATGSMPKTGPQANCSAKIQGSVQSNLHPTSVTNLGPASGPGMDSSGMRGGAYNVNFFVTGVPFGPTGTAGAVPGTTCGRFADGLHIPIPGAPGCPNLNDPTIFTGQPSILNGASGFRFTAHIDSGNANTFLGSTYHVFKDVILGNLGYHHGC